MEYRTKLNMASVQREVQAHLQTLRERGFFVPSDSKTLDVPPQSNAGYQLEGFAEPAARSLQKPKSN